MAIKKILMRRDFAANWEANDPILYSGEIGVELPPSGGGVSAKLKVGDGSSRWSELEYVTSDVNVEDLEGTFAKLEDLPTIDSVLSGTSVNPVQNKVINSAISAKYTKPVDGIPATDLVSRVQTSLGKADSSVQSIKVNGTTKTPSSGIVDLGTLATPSDIDTKIAAAITTALNTSV